MWICYSSFDMKCHQLQSWTVTYYSIALYGTAPIGAEAFSWVLMKKCCTSTR